MSDRKTFLLRVFVFAFVALVAIVLLAGTLQTVDRCMGRSAALILGILSAAGMIIVLHIWEGRRIR